MTAYERPAGPPSLAEVEAQRLGCQALMATNPEKAERLADEHTFDNLKRALYAMGDVVVALPGWPRTGVA